MKFKDRTPGAGEHNAAFGDAGFDLLVPARQSVGHGNDAYIGLLHPIQVEPRAEDLVAFEVGHFLPRKVGAEVVAAIADTREHGLAVPLEPFFKARELLVDGRSDGDALHRIHGAEGQHDLESVHGQLGRLETKTEAADIDDAVLNTFKGVEHLHDRAAVTFDEVDLVAGFGFDRLLEFRLKETFHQARINDGGRMARSDADCDGLGVRRCDGRETSCHESSGGDSECNVFEWIHHRPP